MGAGVLVLVALLMGPATASADTLNFSGRSGKHRHWTWVPEWGLRPYNIAGTVSANLYRTAHGVVADASFGIFYSTAALHPDTLLVYGFEYRKRGGKWRQVCVNGRCKFDSRKQASWPGEPAGGQYFHATLRAKRSRNIQEIRLEVQPLTESGHNRQPGLPHRHTFSVKYRYCNCVLPSSAPARPPPPAPAPQPAPAPKPPVPRDVCAAHPSDPSVVCVRNQGHTVDVCDRDNDSHRAYARVKTDASGPNFQSPFYDDNGSNPGCANVAFPSPVRAVAVCVQNEGCGAFKPT